MAANDGEGKNFSGELNFISINDLLQVGMPGDKSAGNYLSRVNNISQGRIVIAWPTQQGIRLPVRLNQTLNISFLHNEIPYAFDGIAVETVETPIPEVVIAPAGSVTKTQRRQNFRVKCLVPVEITGRIDVPGRTDPAECILFVKTVTVDLSAGGIGAHIPREVPEGTLVEVKLSLPDKGPAIKIPCKIAYTDPLPDNLAMYHCGIQFLAISEREQSRIVRYLHRQQIQNQLV